MMDREEAHDLAKATAEMLGYPYCVCRSRQNPQWYSAFEEEVALNAKWAQDDWEIEATYRPQEEGQG